MSAICEQYEHYKLWPYFRLCNIIEPVTPTICQSRQKTRKERHLESLAHYT